MAQLSPREEKGWGASSPYGEAFAPGPGAPGWREPVGDMSPHLAQPAPTSLQTSACPSVGTHVLLSLHRQRCSVKRGQRCWLLSSLLQGWGPRLAPQDARPAARGT